MEGFNNDGKSESTQSENFVLVRNLLEHLVATTEVNERQFDNMNSQHSTKQKQSVDLELSSGAQKLNVNKQPSTGNRDLNQLSNLVNESLLTKYVAVNDGENSNRNKVDSQHLSYNSDKADEDLRQRTPNICTESPINNTIFAEVQNQLYDVVEANDTYFADKSTNDYGVIRTEDLNPVTPNYCTASPVQNTKSAEVQNLLEEMVKANDDKSNNDCQVMYTKDLSLITPNYCTESPVHNTTSAEVQILLYDVVEASDADTDKSNNDYQVVRAENLNRVTPNYCTESPVYNTTFAEVQNLVHDVVDTSDADNTDKSNNDCQVVHTEGLSRVAPNYCTESPVHNTTHAEAENLLYGVIQAVDTDNNRENQCKNHLQVKLPTLDNDGEDKTCNTNEKSNHHQTETDYLNLLKQKSDLELVSTGNVMTTICRDMDDTLTTVCHINSNCQRDSWNNVGSQQARRVVPFPSNTRSAIECDGPIKQNFDSVNKSMTELDPEILSEVRIVVDSLVATIHQTDAKLGKNVTGLKFTPQNVPVKSPTNATECQMELNGKETALCESSNHSKTMTEVSRVISDLMMTVCGRPDDDCPCNDQEKLQFPTLENSGLYQPLNSGGKITTSACCNLSEMLIEPQNKPLIDNHHNLEYHERNTIHTLQLENDFRRPDDLNQSPNKVRILNDNRQEITKNAIIMKVVTDLTVMPSSSVPEGKNLMETNKSDCPRNEQTNQVVPFIGSNNEVSYHLQPFVSLPPNVTDIFQDANNICNVQNTWQFDYTSHCSSFITYSTYHTDIKNIEEYLLSGYPNNEVLIAEGSNTADGSVCNSASDITEVSQTNTSNSSQRINDEEEFEYTTTEIQTSICEVTMDQVLPQFPSDDQGFSEALIDEDDISLDLSNDLNVPELMKDLYEDIGLEAVSQVFQSTRGWVSNSPASSQASHQSNRTQNWDTQPFNVTMDDDDDDDSVYQIAEFGGTQAFNPSIEESRHSLISTDCTSSDSTRDDKYVQRGTSPIPVEKMFQAGLKCVTTSVAQWPPTVISDKINSDRSVPSIKEKVPSPSIHVFEESHVVPNMENVEKSVDDPNFDPYLYPCSAITEEAIPELQLLCSVHRPLRVGLSRRQRVQPLHKRLSKSQ